MTEDITSDYQEPPPDMICYDVCPGPEELGLNDLLVAFFRASNMQTTLKAMKRVTEIFEAIAPAMQTPVKSSPRVYNQGPRPKTTFDRRGNRRF